MQESPTRLNANVLLGMPREARDLVLASAAAEAEEEYRTDRSLTDFEALEPEAL